MIHEHRYFKPAAALWIVFLVIAVVLVPRGPGVTWATYLWVPTIYTGLCVGGFIAVKKLLALSRRAVARVTN